MTYQLLTRGTFDVMRNSIGATFDHTYTRIQRLPSNGTDAWGQPTYPPPVVTPGLPCHYQDVSQAVVAPGGLENINIPTLLVPGTDSLRAGDLVQNVQYTNKDGSITILFPGPAGVDSTTLLTPEPDGPLAILANIHAPIEV